MLSTCLFAVEYIFEKVIPTDMMSLDSAPKYSLY